ncbi:Pyrroline-5-carboxylate reductase [Caprobacter fermentans]|uniref:Pyrroline-5-carboxylate reductase n=1 Tax=Caproicibacter fermentans TaxID=2576756 RepID=A0A6N8I4A1_9FIRM|nr:pyrroline-5-carboxylate reductase [Caproicibacter fermentans]MVB12956.1 Pyrroline-5-carboxylate reductase [Caproicibacter fermentans]OCN02505.1 pyrroline-5-carboxylate reductase [Clostridium sp. W14A]
MEFQKVGFIGGGNMTSAIVCGVVQANTFPADHIYVFDIHQEKRENLHRKAGVLTVNSALDLVRTCDIIFLAVKPQSFPEMLSEIRPAVNETKTLVSIAAGISSESITGALACSCPVIRAMPNTPLLLGKGATAVCRTENVTDLAYQLVLNLFSSCGIVSQIVESQMDAVISVNGSSPAYIYLFAKAVIESAQKQGIEPGISLPLFCQTLEGSAKMLLDSGNTPDELIRKVSSKGGTTIAALDVLKKSQFEKVIDAAMKACTERAIELGK